MQHPHYQENTTGFFFPHFAPQFLVGCHPQAAHGPCGLWLSIYPSGKEYFTMGILSWWINSFSLHRMLLQVSVLCSQGAEICNFNMTSLVSPAPGALPWLHAAWARVSDTAAPCILWTQLLVFTANRWDHWIPYELYGNICTQAPANFQSAHSSPTLLTSPRAPKLCLHRCFSICGPMQPEASQWCMAQGMLHSFSEPTAFQWWVKLSL